jgi:hypothetical protein
LQIGRAGFGAQIVTRKGKYPADLDLYVTEVALQFAILNLHWSICNLPFVSSLPLREPDPPPAPARLLLLRAAVLSRAGSEMGQAGELVPAADFALDGHGRRSAFGVRAGGRRRAFS